MKKIFLVIFLNIFITSYSQKDVVNDTVKLNYESTKLPKNSFIGKWKDENSVFTFDIKGHFIKENNDGTIVRTKWKWINDNLYVGLGKKNKFIRFYGLQNDLNFMIYKNEGEEITHNAYRIK
ncbi:hypothetical protein [uncultured Flavobacterium sp.]|uniref:hypothetical protein n=1 Tax=uncultured Flavobacterium sp. TaxID=165435 RepID=UPI0025F56E42|nr:hypothetical protein [uncultured Flavobacterium sp.]